MHVLVAGEGHKLPCVGHGQFSWLHKLTACHPPIHPTSTRCPTPVHLRKGEAASGSKGKRKHRRRHLTECSKRHREAWRRGQLLEMHSWKGTLHTGAGTPLMGLWPGRCPRWDRDTLEGPMERTHVGAEEPSSRKKSPCTNPNLLHYHCLAQGPEHNLRAREERGRKLSPSLCLSSGHCISPANW